MGAAVRIEPSAWDDPRFVMLGKMLCTTKFDALGRVAKLWAHCTDRNSHFVTAEVIDIVCDYEGAHLHLVACDLAEEIDGLIRVKGTKGRIEWLANKRKNGDKGGRPRKTKPKPIGYSNAKPIGFPKNNPLVPAPALVPAPVKTTKNIYISDFESVWERYGYKEGKVQAEKTFSKNIKSQDQLDALLKAIENYLFYLSRNPWRAKKNFSTFINNHSEWLNPEVYQAVSASINKTPSVEDEQVRINKLLSGIGP